MLLLMTDTDSQADTKVGGTRNLEPGTKLEGGRDSEL